MDSVFKYQEDDSQLEYTLSLLLILAQSDQCTKVTASHVSVLANSLPLGKYSEDVTQSLSYMLGHGCEQRLSNQFLVERIVDFLAVCPLKQRESLLNLLISFCSVKQPNIQKDNIDFMNKYVKTNDVKCLLLDSNQKNVLILTLEWMKRMVAQERVQKRALKRDTMSVNSPMRPTTMAQSQLQGQSGAGSLPNTPSKLSLPSGTGNDAESEAANQSRELLLSTSSSATSVPSDPQASASASDASSLASSTQSLTASTGVEAAPQSEGDAASQPQTDFEVGETAVSQELGWSKAQQVLYAVVEKLIGHTANTDEDKVFQLCLDIFKEICIVDAEVVTILSRSCYKLLLGEYNDVFSNPEKNVDQLLKLLKYLDKEREANHYLQIDNIVGRIILQHAPVVPLDITDPSPVTAFSLLLFLQSWNNLFIAPELFAFAPNDLLHYLPFLVTYQGDNFKEATAKLLTERVFQSPAVGLQIFWMERVGLCPTTRVKVARSSPSLESTIGFFTMPKLSTGRKIMLETITVDPFTGAILRSCEIKFVFNSASKPLLLELVYQNPSLQPKQLLFKKEEDCRTDFVVQKLFVIFNELWRQCGFPANICPSLMTYGVVNLAKDMACFEYSPCVPLSLFLWESIKELSDAERSTLLHSYAASLVACYILGIRDRNFDNILIKKEHTSLSLIDFKSLWNSSPTNEQQDKAVVSKFKAFFYADWDRLKNICERAMLVLHRNSSLLINVVMQLFDYENERNKENMFNWLLKSLSVGKRLSKQDVSVLVNNLVYEGNKSTLFGW